MKYEKFTHKIIGCAMRVHSALGNGFQEVICQRALEIEMDDCGIPFSREYEMPVFYKKQQIGTRRIDFLIEGKVSVELKAIIQLVDVHLAQAINNLKLTIWKLGCSLISAQRVWILNDLSTKSSTKRIRVIH